MKNHFKDKVVTPTPEIALQFLREGNHRFVNRLAVNRDLLEQVNETRDGQFPFAVVLSCIDSRTSAELIFDQGLGDVFSIRIAGTIINDDILGSMELACKISGSKLVVVLGHTKCGAIRGACNNVQMGNLSTLLNKIQPSVYYEKSVNENRNAQNGEFVEKVSRIQVKRSVESIIQQSIVLREMIEKKEIGLIGAIYDIDTGLVEFLDETFMHGEIKHFYLDVN
jgi:carbonic anhydrase